MDNCKLFYFQILLSVISTSRCMNMHSNSLKNLLPRILNMSSLFTDWEKHSLSCSGFRRASRSLRSWSYRISWKWSSCSNSNHRVFILASRAWQKPNFWMKIKSISWTLFMTVLSSKGLKIKGGEFLPLDLSNKVRL